MSDAGASRTEQRADSPSEGAARPASSSGRLPRSSGGRTSRRRTPRPATIVTLALAIASMALYRWDPWQVSSRRYDVRSDSTGVRRLLPALGDRDPSRATFEFQRPGGEVVRIVPGPIGHQVLEGETLLGPADPLAVDAVWSSLRIASTIRAASPDTNAVVGERGIIRVTLPDLSVVVELGAASSDGAGIYGRLKHEGDDLWVVESEVSWLVEQPAASWLARGLMPVDAAQLASVTWAGGISLSRGVDDLWRATPPAGDGDPEDAAARLLANDAVELRLDRMLNTALDPWLDRGEIEAVSFQPWLSVTTLTGETYNFARGEECPGHPDRWIIDRGPGYLGCLAKDVASEWVVSGDAQGLLETQLIPYPIGRVLAIELQQPTVRRLRRRSGGWQLDEPQRSQVVDEDEVIRWYELLARSEVEPVEGVMLPEDALRISVETDSTQIMQLRCGVVGDDLLCSRDGAPPMRVIAVDRPELSFAAETFAERKLLSFSPDQVRAMELIPEPPGGDGGATSSGVRTSARQDFGVWQLDAPEHPDGAQAIDTIRLESVLAAMSSLRAIEWKDDAPGRPLRTIRLELTPVQGRAQEIVVALEPDCVVMVQGGRRAKIDKARCELLGSEIFFDDPVRALLLAARSLRVLEAHGSSRAYAALINQVATRDKNGWHLPTDGLQDGVEAADQAGRLRAFVDSLERIRGRSLFAVALDADGTPRSPFGSEPGEGEGSTTGSELVDPLAERSDRLVVEIRRSKGNVIVEIEGDRLWMRGRDWGWLLAPPAPEDDEQELEPQEIGEDDSSPLSEPGGRPLEGRDLDQGGLAPP